MRKLYLHTTDGGAEYLSVNPEGKEFIDGVVARTDGDTLKLFIDGLRKAGIKSVTIV